MRKLFWFLVGFIPARFPIGEAELQTFCTKMFKRYGIPDHESYRHTIATMIMHHSQASAHKTPNAFVSAIRKAQANEVAYQYLMDLKDKKKKEQAEAAPLRSEERRVGK